MYTRISPLKFFCSSVLVALGYMTGIFVAGMIGTVFGLQMSAEATHKSPLFLLLIGTVLLGTFIGPFASRSTLSRGQGFILWGSLILFNFGSVILEGAYFAPGLVSMPVPMLVLQQLFATIGASFIIVRVFGTSHQSVSWRKSIQQRPWYSWTWRFLLSAVSYLVFYFAVGGLNYQLVTKPYYETHAGGLTVPAVNVVFIVESIRSILIVFSVFLFLLSVRGARTQLMARTGWLLFAIGGIVPLILQIGTLPFFLLAASAVEIFFQNFLTGVVAASLLGLQSLNGKEPMGVMQPSRQ